MSSLGAGIGEISYDALSDEDVRAYNVFRNVMQAELHPGDPAESLERTQRWLRSVPDFIRFREFWARDPDGSIAAVGFGYWRTSKDNPHLMIVGLDVRPDRRRAGIGRELLHVLAAAARDVGRTLLRGFSTDRVPAGYAFAEKVGAEPKFKAHTNRLVLADVDRDLMARWIDEGPRNAPGYSLGWIDGPYPEDLIEQIVSLVDVMNTAPRDDLDEEDHFRTVEDEREFERALAIERSERWMLYAKHEATGELAGFTEVFCTEGRPDTIGQGNTGVRPEHRGHGLGRWLKATMLERILAERTGMKDIRTGNADSNAPMLAINHAMGFKPYLAATHWELPVERVLGSG